MATAAQALPAPPRRSRQPLAAGRASVREVYFTKRIDNSRVVREVDIPNLRACYTLAIPLGITFILLYIFAWQHFQCVRYGYEIEYLAQQQTRLAEQNRELRAQEESALQQVAPAAQELGMGPVDPRQVIRVADRLDAEPLTEEPQLAETRPAPKPPIPDVALRP